MATIRQWGGTTESALPQGTSRLDSAEGVLFLRQAEVLVPRVLQQPKPALNFERYIPVDGSIAPWANQITERVADSYGAAGIISGGEESFPRIDVGLKENTTRQVWVGASACYTLKEIQQAQALGTELNTRMIDACRRAIMEKVNTIAFYGDAAANLKGLVQTPNALRSVAANPISSASTAAQIEAVLNAGVNHAPNATEQVEETDTLLLPPAEFQYISQTRSGSATDATIKDFWGGSNGYIAAPNIFLVRELRNAQILTGGAETSSDVAIFYRREEEVLMLPFSGIIPLPPLQTGPMSFELPFYAAVGEVILRRPRAVHIVQGV